MRLHHVAVVCGTREKADRFYGRVLGLGTVKEKTLDENFMLKLFGIPVASELVLYGNDQVAVEVFIPDSCPFQSPQLSHICLEVEHRSTFIERCRSAGVAVKEVTRQGAVVVFIQDYDGNLFEIKEAPGESET